MNGHGIFNSVKSLSSVLQLTGAIGIPWGFRLFYTVAVFRAFHSLIALGVHVSGGRWGGCGQTTSLQ